MNINQLKQQSEGDFETLTPVRSIRIMSRDFELVDGNNPGKACFIHRRQFNSQAKFEKYQFTLSCVRDMFSNHLIKLNRFYGHATSNAERQQTFHVTEFYQVKGVSLREFLNDKWARKERLNSEEMTHLLYNLVECCAELQSRRMFCGYIDPDSVFVSDDSGKLSFQLFLADPATIFSKRNYVDQVKKEQGHFWPPDFSIKLQTNSQDLTHKEIVKAEVFSLGLTILEASMGFYIRTPGFIKSDNEPLVNTFLGTFRQLYQDNLLLSTTLEAMLQYNTGLRPDFIKIHRTIPEYSKICSYFEKLNFNKTMFTATVSMGMTPSFERPKAIADKSLIPKSFSPRASHKPTNSNTSNNKAVVSSQRDHGLPYCSTNNEPRENFISPIRQASNYFNTNSALEIDFSFSLKNLHQCQNLYESKFNTATPKGKFNIKDSLREFHETLKSNADRSSLFPKTPKNITTAKKEPYDFVSANINFIKKKPQMESIPSSMRTTTLRNQPKPTSTATSRDVKGGKSIRGQLEGAMKVSKSPCFDDCSKGGVKKPSSLNTTKKSIGYREIYNQKKILAK